MLSAIDIIPNENPVPICDRMPGLTQIFSRPDKSGFPSCRRMDGMSGQRLK